MLTISAVPDTVAPDIATPRHQQLQRAAQQFEAVMLGELMKPMQSGSGIEDDPDESNNALKSYGTEALAGALARSGALGFAGKMIHSLELDETSSQKVRESR